MIRATLLFATAATAVAAGTAEVYGQSSPIVAWSGINNLFSTSVVTEDLTVGDVAPYVELQQTADRPRLVVITALEDAPTYSFATQVTEGSLEPLGEAISAAASTFAIPNTYGAGGSISEFIGAIPGVVGDSREMPTILVQKADDFAQSLANAFDVQQFGDAKATVAAAMAADEIVYVYVSNVDESLTITNVAEKLGAPYVAFAVPAAYEEHEVVAAAGARKLQQTVALSATGLNAVRMTPNIMLGLLLSVILTFFLYIGFTAMMRIQPNDTHWTTENVPLGAKVEM